MSRLLSTKDAAALLGVTPGTFSNCVRAWGLNAAERRGCSNFFSASDVERVRLVRQQAKAARPNRTNRKPKTQADSDAALLASNDWGHGRSPAMGQLTGPEKAIIYAAWLTQTLGPDSQWRHSAPPASYKRHWEAREAARDDAAEWERVKA